jgi:amino acid adenylation domain-containing protein
MEVVLNGFELSPLQKRVWTLRESGHRLFSQVLFSISGVRDQAGARERLLHLLDLHEIFRTRYRKPAHQNYPLQVTGEGPAYWLSEMDWSSEPVESQQKMLEDLFKEFRLSGEEEDVFTHLALIRTGEESFYFLVKTDALSGDAGVLDNLSAAVAASGDCSGDEGSVDDLCQYAQYAQWQQSLLEEENDEALHFWEERTAVRTNWKQLPFRVGIAGPEKHKDLPEVSMVELPSALRDNIKQYGGNHAGNEELLLKTAWMILLASYLDYPDTICLGSAGSGRDYDAFAAINGLLNKTVPFKIAFTKEDSVEDVLEKVKEEMENGQSWQDYYFHAGENVILFEFHKWTKPAVPGVSVSPEKVFLYTEPCSLKLLVHHDAQSGDVRTDLYWDPALLSRQEIAYLGTRFVHTLDRMLQDSTQTLGSLRVSEAGEYAHLSGDPCDWAHDLESGSVPAIFESLAEKVGDRTAAGYKHKVITYGLLNEMSNAYAWHLVREYGVKPGDIVAFQVPRSIQMLHVILGVLKAGAVFLPLDIAIPVERMKFILRDSRAKVLVTQGSIPAEVAALIPHWSLDEGIGNMAGHTQNTGIRPAPNDPAYLIYTSGSTGKPKGVLVPHKALINYCRWFCSAYGVGKDDSSVLFSSIAFDLGFTNLWPLLLSGGMVYLQEETQLLDTTDLSDILLTKKTTVLKLTPSHFNLLLHEPGFKEIVLGGEEPRLQDMETYFSLQPGIVFVNHYGPTETTIGTASKKITRSQAATFCYSPVIGKPVSGNEIFILDGDDGILPYGLTGEIAIGGNGLALGYLNNEALTKEKFIPHPWEAGKRLYRTGDLGRITLNGEAQFLGRKDFQVKIRGYRIELDEIRNVLAGYPGIGEVAVLYLQQGAGSGNLAAYFSADERFEKPGLQEFLARHLPQYMIPSYFITVDALPLTPNGKTDRNALLVLPLEKNTQTGYTAPEKETEKQIAGIWRDLLGVEKIGIHDNFFDLGGNSLKLILMLRELSKIFPGKVTLTDLFRYNTISTIISFLGEEEKELAAVGYEI